MFNYANEWEALNDVRLRGMTFKQQELNIGGGKAVIWAMPKLRKH
jgi:glutamate dehydrogenase/leucine dehydrogenase